MEFLDNKWHAMLAFLAATTLAAVVIFIFYSIGGFQATYAYYGLVTLLGFAVYDVGKAIRYDYEYKIFKFIGTIIIVAGILIMIFGMLFGIIGFYFNAYGIKIENMTGFEGFISGLVIAPIIFCPLLYLAEITIFDKFVNSPLSFGIVLTILYGISILLTGVLGMVIVLTNITWLRIVLAIVFLLLGGLDCLYLFLNPDDEGILTGGSYSPSYSSSPSSSNSSSSDKYISETDVSRAVGNPSNSYLAYESKSIYGSSDRGFHVTIYCHPNISRDDMDERQLSSAAASIADSVVRSLDSHTQKFLKTD